MGARSGGGNSQLMLYLNKLPHMRGTLQWRSDGGAGLRAAPGGTCYRDGKGAKKAEN